MLPTISDELRAEAAADPDLARFFGNKLRGEQVRYAVWREQCEQRQGVRLSGFDPDPFIARDPRVMLEEARLDLANHRAWLASPAGLVAAAEGEIGRTADALCMALEGVAAARSRGLNSNPHAAYRSLDEVIAAARRIIAAAERGQEAVLDIAAAAGREALAKLNAEHARCAAHRALGADVNVHPAFRAAFAGA